MWQDWRPSREVFPRARAAAERALSLDAESPQVLAALASIALYYDWDPPRAESLARRALLLDSTRARAWVYLGDALLVQGRLDSAAVLLRHAVATDTLDEAVAFDASIGLGVTQVDEALALVHRWRTLEPDAILWENAGAAIRVRGHRCAADPPRAPRSPIGLACAGRREAAQAALDSLVRRADRGDPNVRPVDLAVIAAALGDREATLRWLTRVVDDRSGAALFMAVEPLWADVRGDPRFAALVQRVHSQQPGTR